MKSPYSLARRTAVLAAGALILILAGCGQKGPLYRPAIPPDPLTQAAPKPAAPAADVKPAANDK